MLLFSVFYLLNTEYLVKGKSEMYVGLKLFSIEGKFQGAKSSFLNSKAGQRELKLFFKKALLLISKGKYKVYVGLKLFKIEGTENTFSL